MKEFIGCVTFGCPTPWCSRPQPYIFSSRYLLYRGYIANRAMLSAEARRRGCVGRDLTEAELLAMSYEWWGADLSRHVLGEYAVVICDSEQRRLVLAHDQLGIMPLFYSAASDQVWFASHLDDLVTLTGIGELDEEYIADYFARGDHFGGRTPYRHAQRLLPGQNLLWTDGRLTRHGTWTLAKVAPLLCRHDREYDDRLRQLVAEAVEGGLPANRRVWCELSGGLDSSSVLSVSHSVCRAEVEAVSFVYPRSYLSDETKWMQIVLKSHTVPWHPIDADSVQPFTERPTEFFAEPNRWITNAGLNRLYTRLLAEHDVEVVLTGEGGDAVLLGDQQEPYFLADLMLRGRLRELCSEARRWTEASPDRRSLSYFLLAYGLRPAVRQLRSEWIEYRPMPIPWASKSYTERYRLKDRGRAAWTPPSESVGSSYMLQRIMRSVRVVGTLFHQRHIRAEFRQPLLYLPLIEFMLAVPWARKLTPKGDRLLQRRALAGVVPDAILQRNDKGSTAQPIIDGLERGDDWVRALTARPRIVERGYARLEAWREAVQRARVGQTVGFKYFDASAALEIWLQGIESRRRHQDAARMIEPTRVIWTK
jgi:asparagine synthase (glutamine-hydrolysing)